jgi:hypothetical protein
LVEWKRVCWIGLDELDDERKLGWRAMEMGVLIPVGRESLVWLPCGDSGEYDFSCVCVSGENFGVVVRPLFCDIAWASLIWRCQSLVDPRVSLCGAGGVA